MFVYCADMDGVSLRRNNLTGPIALVLGSEGSGVSQLVKKLCDGVVRLDMAAPGTGVDSYNVSVAAGIILYLRSSPNAQHSRHDPAFGPEPQFELQEGQECRKIEIMAGK